jgi:hypothetical protein
MFQQGKKILAGVAALAALALGASAIATAASSSTSPSNHSTSSAHPPTWGGRAHGKSGGHPPPWGGPAHGTAAHEDAEKAVTGADATKARAAAVKAVGGGTAGAVTTDLPGTGFEVTVTKSGGTKLEVHLDSSYKVMQGPGGHRWPPPGDPGGPPPSGYSG